MSLNADTRLLRQVHPNFIQQGRVTSMVFRPTPKDVNQLSMYHGDMISAENAFIHYKLQLGLNSCGVLAVEVQECHNEELSTVHDSDPYPEHCFIDFTNFSKGEIERKSKKITQCATKRGWLYQE